MPMNPRKEIASSLVLILFSIVFLVYTTRYPLDNWESPGPAVFPLILGGILLVLASGQLIRGLLAPKTQPGTAVGEGTGLARIKKFLQNSGGEVKVVILTAMLALYILMMRWIGFFVSTFLLVILTSRLMEARDWGKPVALAAGVCLFCYLLFELWIKLSLPRGLLF
jgi:hypothetical protein